MHGRKYLAFVLTDTCMHVIPRFNQICEIQYVLLLYHHHKLLGGGYNGFALSRRSVGRSVRPSPLSCPLYKAYTNGRIFLVEMLTSTRGCAEPMLQICQRKVKVTVEGQISNNQILDIMSCPLFKSYTN